KNPVVGTAHFEKLKAQYPDLVAYPSGEGMKLAAGWLIEKAGWKGYRRGDAGVHARQALVLVKFHYVTFELVFILALIIAELVLFPFFWCRLFCPTGTFLSLFKSERGMHLKRTADGCSMCGSCRKVCPMGLDPVTDGSSLLCHNCGDCIDACPDNRKKETLRFISGRQN
ncbi:MAG: hypothetical protein LRY50_03340, partial [Geovibrio sp.]|nr:hypothetical protein [Geovibrio sp.]